ncbi:tyrosine-type recombinase/integrase [Candidatus Igneacidithiobacillus taiwanensis]|uniref:tyrosine-type recombinase/integrase n=1 Tax=Candidatus Igneacidithiobacillus taiwanensis TaxID=1945924 RepID=UPI00289D8192|nr:tyrosine-type recombinase/integrase [Candidatus Igneacidithiobacillus taiwanensis]
MASVFKSGKYWRAQIRKTGYPSISKTFDTKAEALAWATQVEAKWDTQAPEQVYQSLLARDLTLKAALERYKAEVLPSKAKKTIRRDEGIIRWWQSSIWQTTPFSSFNSMQLAAAIRALEKAGQSASSIRLYVAVISHLFNIARKEWGFTDLINPAQLVRKPKVEDARDRRLVGNEEERMLAACAAKNPELADFVIIAIETAMRQGEIFALEWSWVDFDKHTIKLPAEITKTKRGRIIPLSERAEEALRRQHAKTKHTARVWSYLNQDGMRASFFKALKVAGIDGLRFHDLRHEATSRLFEQGNNAAVVQAITGHKTAQMLQRYTHLSGESLVKAIRKQDTDVVVAAPSSPTQTNSKRPKFCPQCGTPVEQKWRFCGECGEALA